MASRGFIELLRLADLAKSRSSGRHSTSQSQWLGVVFDVAGQRLIAPMGEITEVLALPEITPIPLAQPWLIGVANVRGRLLPITDLAKFLGLSSVAGSQANRKVMVIDQANIYSGLLVDQVLGIQQFDISQYEAVALPAESPFLPYNHGRFVRDEKFWYVFMPSLLAKDNNYLEAAI
ncbi:chemotaxis protein CheW [Psychrobacter sp. I-STPA6b]|uniref:chemotaxis protein CheW n=1 Tax=Psychrobacter sp. I-STPA6b TaxID=2585718 RepID=UPI001D0CD578|nr:chemotaxis protein CheW [Psychrobacter sp. I-STPA6b]